MGAGGECGKSKEDGEAVWEGNRRAAKSEEKNNTEEGITGNFLFWTVERHRGGMIVF